MGATLAALAAAPVRAEPPRLVFPVDCTLGDRCYIQQYVDRDPGPQSLDFACGHIANDGHKGIDFAVPTLADMARGVDVLAMAPGRIRAIRDGMPDIRFGTAGAPDVDGVECGNGVMIDHADGWSSQYCHLRNGSVRVAQGENVSAGAPIGLIGMSGQADFPHVHVVLRKDGVVVDPYRPADATSCGGAEASAWAIPMPYLSAQIIDAGLSPDVPDYTEVQDGLPEDGIGAEPPAIVLWAYMANGRPGDVIAFEILGPDGPFARRDVELDASQALLMRAFGRRAPEQGLSAGQWVGRLTLTRDGTVLSRRDVMASLPE